MLGIDGHDLGIKSVLSLMAVDLDVTVSRCSQHLYDGVEGAVSSFTAGAAYDPATVYAAAAAGGA